MPDYSTYQILLDTPSCEPAIGFKEQAEQFAQLIRESTPRFAIGIFASWGSGKTTLMNAIRDDLAEQSEVSRDVNLVEFNAWRYERESHLMVPLLDTIRAALEDWEQAEVRSERTKE